MLDDQGERIFSMTDAIAERARKIGGTTVRSIGQISRLQRIADSDAQYVEPLDMIAELRDDNAILMQSMRETHSLCDEAGDVATASLLENWIDEAEKRTWFLFECGRHACTQNERYATEDRSRTSRHFTHGWMDTFAQSSNGGSSVRTHVRIKGGTNE